MQRVSFPLRTVFSGDDFCEPGGYLEVLSENVHTLRCGLT